MSRGAEATGAEAAPKWDLSSVYPSFDSPEYRQDLSLLGEKIAAFLGLLEKPLPSGPDLAAALVRLIGVYEEAGDLGENLSAYAEAIYTADTRDSRALREINAIEAAALPLGKAAALFRNRLAGAKGLVAEALETDPALKPYVFFIRESLEKAARQMSPELEDLANDLARSGGDAWGRLQEAVSSTVTAVWDAVSGERKTVIALRDLAHDPDRGVRERAYRAELGAWQSMEIPLAASLNGVKGTALTLDKRRGWQSPVQKSAFQSRISEKALGSLIDVLEGSLPLFRRYLKAKASLLGVSSCAFYDLFAPAGRAAKKWAWSEATEFIVRQFAAFDPEMGAFAEKAVSRRWIDAPGREGKVGGAYCASFPLAGLGGETPRGEVRILCNFEGSFDSVFTLAHELGHGWHHETIKDLSRFRSAYPMTLAETASIFAETIVFEGALDAADNDDDRTALIEGNLKDCCQVIVDILSRFYFETALFERRDQAELSPQELCAMMIEAQKKTYGDALDNDLLHPYMWAVKSHYYNSGLGFYNYPYAFGQLFSLGLFARAQAEGPGFARTYRELLRLTGQAEAGAVAAFAGFDIEDPVFWQGGAAIIEKRVLEFEKKTKVRGGNNER
ncbi:MAG: M3 family oligoendopeptidase [Treponema sp.]|jgi:pepF/M3 family oligoendopeptidase|nr:M3 family oligoendopeptidase [Treponema sp.]